MSAKRGIPVWVWLLAAAPVALITLGMAVSLGLAGVQRYLAQRELDESAAADASAAQNASAAANLAAPTDLQGQAVDLSTVMGRARKLADHWQPEASLLGIEATLRARKIQTQEGAGARLTFGPSRFAASPTTGGLFVVVYDQGGLRGAPAAGSPSKALPEPMCAPEHALAQVTALGEGPLSLRYALDASQRPMWLVSPSASPEQLRLLDPQDCQPHGIVVGRGKR